MMVQRLQTSFAQTGLKGLVVFLSGASALTYEIVWQREMFHIFGASAPATAAILTAIFLGIAFGSWMSSLFVDRVKRSVLLLAALEGMIAAWGLLVPSAMSVSETCYVLSAHAFGEASALLTFVRFTFAIVTLLPSTLCMGASIPVMVRALGDGQTSSVAWIYGLNILGAVVGALATGLIFIRTFGQAESAFVAVGLNLAVVVLLLILAPRAEETRIDEPASEDETVSSYPWLSTMYFAAGFVALGIEIVWLRFLGIVNSNSTVTFSLTLAFYLGGWE